MWGLLSVQPILDRWDNARAGANGNPSTGGLWWFGGVEVVVSGITERERKRLGGHASTSVATVSPSSVSP